MNRSYYIKLREKFKPTQLNLIFLLESPPQSGKYFYDINGLKSEPLFREMMKVFEIAPNSKKEGLKKFQELGFYLVDSTYIPVNHIKSKSKRKAVIQNDYINLLSDLKKNIAGKNTPIIIVKTTLYDQLINKLIKDGFNIINANIRIPFPARHPKVFRDRMKLALTSLEISQNG